VGGKAPRRKGNAGEREIAKLLGGQRIPLSGAAGGRFTGDVVVPVLGVGEVKRRKNGFKQLYAWLDGNDFVAVRADRQEWLIVLPVETVKELLDGRG